MRSLFLFLALSGSLQMQAQLITAPMPKDLLDANSKAMVTLAIGTLKLYETHPAHYAFLQKFVGEKMREMGIQPAVFIDYSKYAKGGMDAPMTVELEAGITHHFIFSIRSIPKAADDAAGYKKIWIHAGAFKGESMVESSKGLNAVVSDETDIISALAKLAEIISSNADYFESEGEPVNLALSANQKQGIPADLPKSGVLLIKFNDGELIGAEGLNKALEKYLSGSYPYKFKVIDRYDLEKEKSEVFKYLLFPTQQLMKETTVYSGPTSSNPASSNEKSALVYYVGFALRDLNTNEEYICLDRMHSNFHIAMKSFIKLTKKKFGVK